MEETPVEERLNHIEQTLDGWEEKRKSLIPDDNRTAQKATKIILRNIRAIVEDNYHKTAFEDRD